jgi:hypothetical protein
MTVLVSLSEAVYRCRAVRVDRFLRLRFFGLGASILAISGCAAEPYICRNKTTYVTGAAVQSVYLPNGCNLLGADSSSFQRVVCDDGRSGFSFAMSLEE